MAKKNDEHQASPWVDLLDFKVFTGELVARKDADGVPDLKRPQVTGIGSSELEDLAGDKMLRSAMDDMRNFAIRSPIFMNHRYDVPEDVFGAIKVAPDYSIERDLIAGVKRAPRPYYAIKITSDVAQSNPRAMDSFKLISVDEIRLGFSIGCEITDYDIRMDDDGLPLGLDIAHLRTLEWSIVGIPCNTESWVQDWAEKGFEGLARRKAKIPTVKSASELVYVAKNFGDFDDITGLYLRRLHESPKLAYVVDNFDEIREEFGPQVSTYMETLNGPLQKHGFCIARYPQKR